MPVQLGTTSEADSPSKGGSLAYATKAISRLLWKRAALLLSAADGFGFSRLGFSDLIEHRSFWGSGQPLGALAPFSKVGGEAPHLYGWF